MAKEYIERDVAIEKTETFCDVFVTNWTDEKVLAWIKNLPTADVVEVVRCWDCKHCVLDLRGGENHLCMREKNGFPLRMRVAYDDFCSFGERMDNDV